MHRFPFCNQHVPTHGNKFNRPSVTFFRCVNSPSNFAGINRYPVRSATFSVHRILPEDKNVPSAVVFASPVQLLLSLAFRCTFIFSKQNETALQLYGWWNFPYRSSNKRKQERRLVYKKTPAAPPFITLLLCSEYLICGLKSLKRTDDRWRGMVCATKSMGAFSENWVYKVSK